MVKAGIFLRSYSSEEAGYCMWTNGDSSGKKTSNIATGFTVLLTVLAPLALVFSYANLIWVIGGTVLGLVMLWLCWKFRIAGDRVTARKLFFYTLLYLPLALLLLAVGWK